MDPTTTLITFMLQTSPSVRSVQLVGSWDNFTKHYAMQKDSRRARGQWRGCYAFDNIIYDGDGSASPIRKGGLKMGHTYWYYYKVDGETEIHDATLPSTTSCPILPGQPVNFLSIPVEKVLKRDRSASLGSYTEPLKTMNPDAKYETPRLPPPTPKPTRLNTSIGCEGYLRPRPTRSESPKSRRSPWSPRTLFGPKTPVSATAYTDSFHDRGRTTRDGDANISYPVLISRTDEGRNCVSLQDMQQKRDDSPVKQLPQHSIPKLNLAALDFDEDDDANFARPSIDQQRRESQLQPTILSPPPSRISSARGQSKNYEHAPTLRLLTATNKSETDTTSKPLPSIPAYESEASSSVFNYPLNSGLAPAPLRLTSTENSMRILRTDLHVPSIISNWTPRSHFSMDSLDEVVLDISEESHSYLPSNAESDTLSSGMISPTDSLYSDSYASTSSLAEYYDADDAVPVDFSLVNSSKETAMCSDEDKNEMRAASPNDSEFQYNPIIAEVSARGFQGYSLPDSADYGSEITLKREITFVESDDAPQIRSARATFGGPISSVDRNDNTGGTLQGLLNDLGYLGEVISS